MPYDENEDEEIKKHGNLSQWLKYQVKVGPVEVAGQWLAAAVVLLVVIAERLVF